MKCYVVTHNDVDHGNKLMGEYENIEGKTPLDAVKRRFGGDFIRLMGAEGGYASVIIVSGYYNPQTRGISYQGKYARYCYGRKSV